MNLPTQLDIALEKKALALAFDLHDGQMRDYNNGPYIIHPVRVARLVSWFAGQDSVLHAAALLHDTVEDCGVTTDWLEHELGNAEVPELVEWLTEPDFHGEGMREKRISGMLDKLSQAPAEARIIKCCDRMDNLHDRDSRHDGFYRKKYIPESYRLLEALRKGPEAVDERTSLALTAALEQLETHIEFTARDVGYTQ